jgi:hypothetical protein
MMKLICAAVLAAWAVVMMAGTAGADPTPAPTPGPAYQIPSNAGPVLGGVQTYQPTCLVAPLACGLKYDPSTGTWQPEGSRNPSHQPG